MQTQSEILGVNTFDFGGYVPEENKGAFDTIRGIWDKSTTVLASVFDNGLEIYGGITERINALNQIKADTVEKRSVEVQREDASNSGVMPSAKTLMIGAGVAVILLVALKK